MMNFIKKLEDLTKQDLEGKLVLFGGSFNPLHKAHLALVENLKNNLDYDNLFFVPTYYPPHKEIKDLLPYTLRLHYLEEYIREGQKSYKILDAERYLPRPSYTINLIEKLHLLASEKMAKMELYFIIGADEAINFQAWHRYREFAGKCKLLIAKRPNYPEEKLKECCLNLSLQK